MRVTSGSFDRRLEVDVAHPISVAVSSGADSLLTLIETAAWAHANGRQVVALSVDHGLQSGSDRWTSQAGEAARRLSCGFQALRWDGGKPAAGLPAAARLARHRLLADAARGLGAKVIVTGHTGDDALENAAMGQGGLIEWSPSPVWPQGRGLCLLRPLLGERRAAIRQRLTTLGWTWVDDPANANLASPRIAARARIAGGGSLPAQPDPAEAAALARHVIFAGEVLRLPRDAYRAARPEARRRTAAAAVVCTGGGQAPPRGERLDRLAGRLADLPDFTATLAGAKIIAESEAILFVRDAGETARGGLAPIAAPGVWDGRYEIGVPGEIHALRGLTSRLPADQKRRLAAIPAPARPGLPVILRDGAVSCPVLAPVPDSDIRPLVLERFLTACGVYAHERDL